MSAVFADPDERAKPRPPAHVLRGPEHADNYRIKVGRYKDRWYRDPLPYCVLAPEALADEAYPSVSIVKGASGKDWTYVALKRTAKSDELAEIAAKGYYERYERLKVVNSLDLSAAMRRGNNVHTYAECLAYGVSPWTTLSANSDGAAYFPIIDKLFADLQPELVAAEVVVIHRTLNGVGYGGTGDGIFRIDGKLYKVDWKSRGEDSDHDAYPEEAGQIGAYAGAEYMIVADDDPANPHGAKRIPVPKLDGGLIVSIKPDSYEVYPIDLTHAVDHFEAMHAWWLARRDEGRCIGSKWAPRVAREAVASTEADNARRDALYARHDALTDEGKDDFARRVRNINANDLDAVEQLIADIESPPTIRDMARRRMTRDSEREADRRLSAEGGPGNPEDVTLFETRWGLGLHAPGRKWLVTVIHEGVEAGVDFRYTALPSQRRCDLFCALTEWATVDAFDWTNDTALRSIISTLVGAPDDVFTATLGSVIGNLSSEQAVELRDRITEIAGER